MAYSEQLANPVRALPYDRDDVAERPMFGGLTFPTTRPRRSRARWTSRAGRCGGFVTVAPDGLKGQALGRWVVVAHAEAQPPKQRKHKAVSR